MLYRNKELYYYREITLRNTMCSVYKLYNTKCSVYKLSTRQIFKIRYSYVRCTLAIFLKMKQIDFIVREITLLNTYMLPYSFKNYLCFLGFGGYYSQYQVISPKT